MASIIGMIMSFVDLQQTKIIVAKHQTQSISINPLEVKPNTYSKSITPPKQSFYESKRSCVFKNTMTNEDYEACGLLPPLVKKNNILHKNTFQVQSRLRELGYYQMETHGTLDTYTIDAIKLFQNDRKIPITGQPDFNTLRALRIQ